MSRASLLTGNNIIYKKNIRHFIDIYARKDNWHNIDQEKGNLGYGWIHYGLIGNMKPKRVLVIGSKYGFIPAICALACRDNEKGIVDFVDAGYDQANPRDNSSLGGEKNRHWGGVGFWTKVDIEKHFGAFDISKYIHTYVTTSAEFKKRNPNRKWGYVYIDGDHSYQGVKADFRRFWPSVTKGGILSLHDLYTEKLGGLHYGVSQFWKEKKKESKYNCIEIHEGLGLGIIQK